MWTRPPRPAPVRQLYSSIGRAAGAAGAAWVPLQPRCQVPARGTEAAPHPALCVAGGPVLQPSALAVIKRGGRHGRHGALWGQPAPPRAGRVSQHRLGSAVLAAQGCPGAGCSGKALLSALSALSAPARGVPLGAIGCHWVPFMHLRDGGRASTASSTLLPFPGDLGASPPPPAKTRPGRTGPHARRAARAQSAPTLIAIALSRTRPSVKWRGAAQNAPPPLQSSEPCIARNRALRGTPRRKRRAGEERAEAGGGLRRPI